MPGVWLRQRAPAAALLLVSTGLVLWGLAYQSFGRRAALAQDAIDRADALEAVIAHADLRPWVDVPGVASAAATLRVNLSLLAQGVDVATDSAGEDDVGVPAEHDLARLLRRAPTDVGAWLTLAALRWAQGQTARAVQAWQMAALLAPREAAAAAARVALAVVHWGDLQDGARRSASRDVVLVLTEGRAFGSLRMMFRDLPQETRDRVAQDLQGLIGLGPKDAEALGLSP